MFLTLTVPHSEKGFRGKVFYQKEIKDLFNALRRNDLWKEWVYGGEFGLEITRNKSGLHIHIHSLIFVKTGTMNRNKLHRIILIEWNKLTIDEDVKRSYFDESTITGIKKSNSMLTDEDIEQLNPKGATIINLRTVYNYNDKGEKEQIKEFASSEMMFAVMEAISYHFAPTTFDKSKDQFDLPLLVDLLPVLYNLRIYDRFGILYKETPLSLNDNSYIEDLEEVLELKENNLANIGQADYFVTNPAYVFHIQNKNNKIVLSHEAQRRRIDLSATNTTEALEELNMMVKLMHTKQVGFN